MFWSQETTVSGHNVRRICSRVTMSPACATSSASSCAGWLCRSHRSRPRDRAPVPELNSCEPNLTRGMTSLIWHLAPGERPSFVRQLDAGAVRHHDARLDQLFEVVDAGRVQRED